MNELDQRYKRKGISGSSCTPSKPRRLGNPSVSIPPVRAPELSGQYVLIGENKVILHTGILM